MTTAFGPIAEVRVALRTTQCDRCGLRGSSASFAKLTGMRRFQARELRDIPRLEAFCRVALVVRFSVRAMLAVRVFFFASDFSVRTSDAVHSRRFDFLAI